MNKIEKNRKIVFSLLPVIVLCFSTVTFGDESPLAKEEKIKMEADYILACQYINPRDSAHGAINEMYGEPTWIIPHENAMAILGLLDAAKILKKQLYYNRAQFAIDYLTRIQDAEDGGWYDHYDHTTPVDLTKSTLQTAGVMMALYQFGYDPEKYNAMKKGAQFLLNCQKVECKGGNNDGLLGGGKEANGQYQSWRWAHDNSYAYWALIAANSWADKKNDLSFSAKCATAAQKIIDGIDTYLYDVTTGVWHCAIDENGNHLKNPHLPCLDANANIYVSWIQYSPQLLDLPVNGVNSSAVGEWIYKNFAPPDNQCIGSLGYDCVDGELKIRKYPEFALLAALCWYDTGHSSYSEATIKWLEKSTLWQTSPDLNGISGCWINWDEVKPEPHKTADWWLRFINTSFYSIACWNKGYNFVISANIARSGSTPTYSDNSSKENSTYPANSSTGLKNQETEIENVPGIKYQITDK